MVISLVQKPSDVQSITLDATKETTSIMNTEPHLSALLSNYKKGRTHSDDDYDDEKVVLRTKSYSTISTTSTKTNRTKFSYMDRSFSVPMEDVRGDGSSNPGGINNIERIRSFLQSDYVPDEYWNLQRDSFIHRSYNEKLVARKNAIDYPKRPISVPPPPPTTQSPQLTQTETETKVVNAAPLIIKRDSFIRHSLNTIRRSFSIKSSAKKKIIKDDNDIVVAVKTKAKKKNKKKIIESEMENDSGGFNSNGGNINVNKSDNLINSDKGLDSTLLNVPLEIIRNGHSRNSSTSSCTSNR